MAHQWFGDLVTMAWWDDIWLNEGFATWMANHPLAAWQPDWNVDVDEALESQTALNLDSLKSTRPIHARVDTPAQIDEAFDAIAYQKGAAVLRMIESYVDAGDVPQRRQRVPAGARVRQRHVRATSGTRSPTSTGKPVDKVMPTFVNQPGVPLVTRVGADLRRARKTETQRDDRAAALFARRRRASRRALPSGGQVPVCCRSRPRLASIDCLRARSRPSEQARVGSRDGCAPWVFANAGAHGYYRTEYPPDMLRALAPQVEDGPERPPSACRSSATNGRSCARIVTRIADYLTLAAGFGREQIERRARDGHRAPRLRARLSDDGRHASAVRSVRARR